MDLDLPLKFILSFTLGALIGLEREINEKRNIENADGKKTAILGLRSFSLVAVLGTICGLIYPQFPLLSAILASLFGFILLMFYYLDSSREKDFGFTTEIAVIYSFVLGLLLSINIIPIQLIIATTVVVILLMSRKKNIKNIVEEIKQGEINAFVSFAILAFVVLPFLPDKSFTLSDLGISKELFNNLGLGLKNLANLEFANPFNLWMIVVLITGIDILGYALERTIGRKKGGLIAAFAGGFVSSTATTISIAQDSKHSNKVNSLVSIALFANAVSFLPTGFLLLTLNPQLLFSFFPTLIVLIITLGLIGAYFSMRTKHETIDSVISDEITKTHKIFDLAAALKFMSIFLLINIFSKLALELFGNTGFLVTTSLGALTGIDAVVVNIAQLTGANINLDLALWALILVNAVNLLAKSFYSLLQGSREFALKFFLSIVFVIFISIIPVLIPQILPSIK